MCNSKTQIEGFEQAEIINKICWKSQPVISHYVERLDSHCSSPFLDQSRQNLTILFID
jgi:hypothetical protein